MTKRFKIAKYLFEYKEEKRLTGNETEIRAFFKETLVKKIDDNIRIYNDKHGRTILYLYESIPTFDAEDREWNSYRELYVVKEKGKYQGYYLTGGYHLAKASLFTDMKVIKGEEK